MGRFKHDAIVLTGVTAVITDVQARAAAHFEGSGVHVSNVTDYGVNDTSSFLIAPRPTDAFRSSVRADAERP